MGRMGTEMPGGCLPCDDAPPVRKVGGIRKSTVPILLGGIAGVILLLWGNTLFPSCNRNSGQTAQTPAESYDAGEERIRAYRAELETRIEELCRQVKGAGEVTAAVSLDGGFRAVYAEEEKSGVGGTYRVYVTVGSGSSQSAVFITEEPPPVNGIGIVCSGGDDMNVRAEITALLSAAFSVGANKIYVTGR